jgi:hypothetical protein
MDELAMCQRPRGSLRCAYRDRMLACEPINWRGVRTRYGATARMFASLRRAIGRAKDQRMPDLLPRICDKQFRLFPKLTHLPITAAVPTALPQVSQSNGLDQPADGYGISVSPSFTAVNSSLWNKSQERTSSKEPAFCLHRPLLSHQLATSFDRLLEIND